MKLIAFYLPQYHQIPENDEWWGKGFTEWTNVKKAKAVFNKQIQPKKPLNNNYYDLMKKSTVEWQTELMKKYGIYGFCYFHYWFTGKKLLERPAENLLKWNDIDQPFCFAWANVTWARTWSAVKEGTTEWVSMDKKSSDSGILMEQKYGDKEDWLNHYNYLRQFFKDNRYIKFDKKPVFLIYHLENIPCSNEMFTLWNDCARQDGFPGLHLVSINKPPVNNPYIEAVAMYGNYNNYDKHIIRQGINIAIHKFHLPIKKIKNVLSYQKVWKNLVLEEPFNGIRTYPGAVVTYDETPRKGRNGIYIKDSSATLFKKYLKLQIEKAIKNCKVDFIFIDAWNEWGEGNYLEPDEEHGYEYLEAVKEALEEIKL